MNNYNERDIAAKQKALDVAKYHLEAAIMCGASGVSLVEHEKEVDRRQRALNKAMKGN